MGEVYYPITSENGSGDLSLSVRITSLGEAYIEASGADDATEISVWVVSAALTADDLRRLANTLTFVADCMEGKTRR